MQLQNKAGIKIIVPKREIFFVAKLQHFQYFSRSKRMALPYWSPLHVDAFTLQFVYAETGTRSDLCCSPVIITSLSIIFCLFLVSWNFFSVAPVDRRSFKFT